MAVQTFQGISILLAGYEASCRSKSFEAPVVSFGKLDSTSLCSTWEESAPGIGSWTWSGSLMQDHAANQVDQIIGTTSTGVLAAGATPLTLLPAGSTAGSVAYFGNAGALAYTPVQATHGEIAMAMVSGSGRGPAVRGQVIHASAARTSSSSGTGIQLGALTAAQRMYAALHITAVSGTTPTLVVKVQSDDNSGFTTPTDRITFSTASAIGGEFSSVAGAVTDDWWRVTWTLTGTSPSFTFVAALGIGALS